MEVKCPKCRFRYDTPAAAGINELACVCPRCGIPFTVAITEEMRNQPQTETPTEGKEGAVASGVVDATVSGQPAQPVSPGQAVPAATDANGNKEGWIENTLSGGSRSTSGQSHSRGCLRNCLVVFLIAFVGSVIAVRNCFGERSYKQTMLENGVNESLNELGDGAVVSDAKVFVKDNPEPTPEWLEGAWRVETEYGVITITIHGNQIAEESGEEISRGTFYYKKGKLYCDFGDGEPEIRDLNMKRKCIDAGDGMLMEKQ
ncbi:MAG: hypothetical protein K6C10_01740 [Prevotella sp.]|nr:hypothetical protein [Prevotella sp.]